MHWPPSDDWNKAHSRISSSKSFCSVLIGTLGAALGDFSPSATGGSQDSSMGSETREAYANQPEHFPSPTSNGPLTESTWCWRFCGRWGKTLETFRKRGGGCWGRHFGLGVWHNERVFRSMESKIKAREFSLVSTIAMLCDVFRPVWNVKLIFFLFSK